MLLGRDQPTYNKLMQRSTQGLYIRTNHLSLATSNTSPLHPIFLGLASVLWSGVRTLLDLQCRSRYIT